MKYLGHLVATGLLVAGAQLHAEPGLPREAYGVWDRSGFNTVAQYPFTRGQSYAETWFNVNRSRGVFDWTTPIRTATISIRGSGSTSRKW